ncbi:MAG: hypothetical protein H6625_04975 [Bdellovibrionaceae bacterium]|nr:hypothetical protein [Pseudobdellovibrionaceae bacterium]
MKSIKGINNQNGQAVMEYVLVLIVLVFVFLILLQFNKQFRKWGEDYFISYYRCLLETGELPSLGGQNNTGGICFNQFQPFTFTGGWQPYPGGGSGGGNSGSGNGSGGKNGKGSGGGNASSSASKKADDGSGGGSRGGEVSRAGSGRSGSGSGRFSRFKSSSSENGSERENSKQKKGMYTGSSQASNFSSNNDKSRLNKKTKGLDYGYGIQRQEQDRGSESTMLSAKKSAMDQKKEQRFKIMKKTVKKETQLEEDEFTLGNFFRILIIAAIIIALGVLIGGQLLQISKGMDAES